MLSAEQVEELNEQIQLMDRKTITEHLQHFPARFPIDFTPDFFEKEPLSRLRHILFGLCLHNKRTLYAISSMAA